MSWKWNTWGTQRNYFNLGYDLEEWALPFSLLWDAAMVRFGCLCIELVYWKKLVRVTDRVL